MIWKFPFRNGLSNSEEPSNFLKIQKTNYFTKKDFKPWNSCKGIAHELENPLNFVVNISIISQDLLNQILRSKSAAERLQLPGENHKKISIMRKESIESSTALSCKLETSK
jgi:hypothetical protein